MSAEAAGFRLPNENELVEGKRWEKGRVCVLKEIEHREFSVF